MKTYYKVEQKFRGIWQDHIASKHYSFIRALNRYNWLANEIGTESVRIIQYDNDSWLRDLCRVCWSNGDHNCLHQEAV